MAEKQFDCVIDTKSKEERKHLVDYITNKDGIVVSNIDDFEGFQYVGINRGAYSILAIISPDNVKDYEDMHFPSVDEYIAYSDGKQ
jgi:hypothetical protein